MLGYRSYMLKRAACVNLGRVLPRNFKRSRRVNGALMEFDVSDLDQRYFFFGIPTEPENTALLRAIGNGRGVYIDVGANFGHFADDLRGSFHAMYLCEPNPLAASFLRKIFPVDAVIEVALSHSEGTAILAIPHGHSGGASLMGSKGAIETVRTITLDAFVAERGIDPLVIKMDVEGHEEDVLRGARTTIAEKKPIIAFEAHTPECFDACTKLLPGGWSLYTVRGAMPSGLRGLPKWAAAAKLAVRGPRITVERITRTEAFASLVFAVHPDKAALFAQACRSVEANGIM